METDAGAPPPKASRAAFVAAAAHEPVVYPLRMRPFCGDCIYQIAAARAVDLAVTGASGFVARRLISRLRGRCRITPVSRSGTGYGAGLERALRGCGAVAHLAGSGAPGGYGYGNAEVTESVVRAASAAGVRTLVYLSGLGVSARNTSAYFASKLRAEKAVRSSGLRYAILRPSYIVGGSDYLSRCLRAQARRGRVLVPGDGRYAIQPVLADDAVSVIEKALRGGRFSGRVLDLVGPRKIEFARYAGGFARAHGARLVRVPLAEAVRSAVSGDFPYSADDLSILLGGFEGDYGALRRAYGAELSEVRAPRRGQAALRARSPPR